MILFLIQMYYQCSLHVVSLLCPLHIFFQLLISERSETLMSKDTSTNPPLDLLPICPIPPLPQVTVTVVTMSQTTPQSPVVIALNGVKVQSSTWPFHYQPLYRGLSWNPDIISGQGNDYSTDYSYGSDIYPYQPYNIQRNSTIISCGSSPYQAPFTSLPSTDK